MQVIAHKSTDGQFFESFEEYKAHEETLQITTKLNAATLNDSHVSQDDRGNDVVYVENLPKFIAANAQVLREILESSVVVKRGRGAGKKNKPKAAAEQAA